MINQIKRSSRILVPLGTAGGFVSDFLTPLGPITKWIFFGLLIISILLLVFSFFRKKSESSIIKNYLTVSIILTFIFGIFFLLNNNNKKGLLGDNIDIIENLQNSLFNIQETVDRIEEKVDRVEKKIDVRFDNIEHLIQTSNPIENPTTPKDFILNGYLFKLSGSLKKSQESFEKYFELSRDYKIDVLLDYADVFETNNGYMDLKTQLDFFPKTETTQLVKMIITSLDDKDLYYSLLRLDSLNNNLVKWAVLTIPPSMANAIAGKEEEFFNWKYNCMFFHSSLGYYCENVHQYFFNKGKAKELIETNSFTKQPGYFFYVDYKKLGSTAKVMFGKSMYRTKKGKELDSLYRLKREEGWFK